MTIPTPPDAAYVRAHSKVDFSDPDLGYPVESPDDLFQEVVDQAVSYIESVTARPYIGGAPIPVSYVPLMAQAVRMRTEQIVQESQATNVENVGDFDMISSFTAGAYSETRRGLADANEMKAGMLNPWPALNRLLWLLLGLAPGEVNDAVTNMFDYWRYMLGL